VVVTDEAMPGWAGGLGLRPHPEGGFYTETWRSATTIPADALPGAYAGARAVATSIYFLLAPGQESGWHAVRSDELWFWHRGGPLLLSLGGDGPRPAADPQTIRLGPALELGERPQARVPAGHWQAARPGGESPVLVSCVVAPGFDFADFRLA
jgi:uncharacterized protein